MEENSMIQKAGNNSVQYQVEKYYDGISGKELENVITDIRNFISEENKLLLENMRIVATETAQERLDNYTEILIPRLVKAEILTAFSEPAMQFLFKESEKTAISTDRETDYEMLSELLVHRIYNKEDYTISAAISKAINEVNNISEEALLTLTLVYAIQTYIPLSGNIREGLATLDTLYGQILKYYQLPEDTDWVDNLEVVNALKVTTIGGSKKLDDYFYEKIIGYSLLGIKKDNNDLKNFTKRLKEAGLPTSILVENEFDKEYVRLEIASESSIDDMYLNDSVNDVKKDLTDSQKQIIFDIYKSYSNAAKVNQEKFNNALREFKNINTIIEWWNNNITNLSFKITAIGKVIACANAIRIDSTLPNPIHK